MLFLELDHAAQLDLLERLARAAMAEHYDDLAGPGLVLAMQQYEDNAVWRTDTVDGQKIADTLAAEFPSITLTIGRERSGGPIRRSRCDWGRSARRSPRCARRACLHSR